MIDFDLPIECLGKRKQIDIVFHFDSRLKLDGATIYSESNKRDVSEKYLKKLVEKFQEEINTHLNNIEQYVDIIPWEDHADDLRRGIDY
jgi:hypothetical protein